MRAQPMGSVGPAHPAEARPIGSAMAAPVRDREALQRLSFLFQGPLGEASRVPPLLLPPAARGRGCLRLRGGGQPRAVLRCRSCGRFRRYLCQRELRPLGQAPPTATEQQHELRLVSAEGSSSQ
ncbi:ribonuclease P protein subunit p21 isoform X5 [Ciconia boyciana]|uniref:ribonuclease P protein subunit p21 isoform X5 n=1 Tax=Ciconia boyciana TaxID=52775 RepID=UPI003B9EC0AC